MSFWVWGLEFGPHGFVCKVVRIELRITGSTYEF
jgi:hypothetical protein